MEKSNQKSLSQRWAERNRDKVRESKRNWNKKNKKLKSQLQRKYAKRHPEIIKAHNYKHNHHIILKDNCEFCGYNIGLEGHHPDYNKPDFIVTVCKLCHSKIHYTGGK